MDAKGRETNPPNVVESPRLLLIICLLCGQYVVYSQYVDSTLSEAPMPPQPSVLAPDS